MALARAGNWVLLLAVVGGAVLLWPTALGGCTTLTVVSGRSMEPTYVTGDLVVARCGPAEVGDVVVYEPPGEEGARVIHRVVDGDATGWVVQGDNNDFLDPWRPTADDVVGVGRWHVPGLGTVAAILLSPLTGVSVLLLALAVLVWPQREATGGASS
nr:signal peptidase I [uncultured Actinotalea sp.]